MLRILYPAFANVSMAKYVENFNLQIPHDHTCRRSLEIQPRFLKLHFKTGRSYQYIFSFVSFFFYNNEITKTKIGQKYNMEQCPNNNILCCWGKINYVKKKKCSKSVYVKKIVK